MIKFSGTCQCGCGLVGLDLGGGKPGNTEAGDDRDGERKGKKSGKKARG